MHPNESIEKGAQTSCLIVLILFVLAWWVFPIVGWILIQKQGGWSSASGILKALWVFTLILFALSFVYTTLTLLGPSIGHTAGY